MAEATPSATPADLPAGLWVAIPVFNNGGTVREVVMACRREVPRVVVVDDGSTDTDVEALLRDTGATVLRHPRNLGKGQALLTALRYVAERGGETLITLDADGQHHPADLRVFLPVVSANPTAIVIGARRMAGEHVPLSSRFGRQFSDFWLRLETGLAMRDTQSGFRAYPVACVLSLNLRGRRYDFEVEVLAKGAWAGLQVKSVDVDVTYARKGQRISHFKPVLDNVRITHRHVLLLARRLWPWPHRQLVKREEGSPWAGWRHPVRFFRMLLVEHATPVELGMAAAVGTFIATLPLLSLHTVLILYVATRLRLNRMMAVTIQNLCMPPVVPFLCVELGYFMRYGRWLRDMTKEAWLYQAPQRVWEWFLGSLVAAPLIALITGVLVFGVAALLSGGTRGGRGSTEA